MQPPRQNPGYAYVCVCVCFCVNRRLGKHMHALANGGVVLIKRVQNAYRNVELIRKERKGTESAEILRAI